MKIAVTGAGGFIGRHLVPTLREEHEVLALTRQTSSATDSAAGAVHTDYSLEQLRQLLPGCDALIHLAAQRPYAGENAQILENGLLDYRIFQAAEDCGVRHVVYISTRGVYGKQPTPWSEATPPAPGTLYAVAKLHSEETAAYFLRRGLCITTLRLAQIFGLGEYDGSAITTFLKSAYQGMPIHLTVTGVRREYLYVRDVVGAMQRVLAHPLSGIYNLGSGEITSLEDMALAIVSAFGQQGNILKQENPRDLGEYSLMDSTKFRESFSWTPRWSFAEAAKDIARTLEDKETARRYGLSIN